MSRVVVADKRGRGRPPKSLDELLCSGGLRMERHASRILEESPAHEPWPSIVANARAYLERKAAA